jgi:hypothetical protein
MSNQIIHQIFTTINQLAFLSKTNTSEIMPSFVNPTGIEKERARRAAKEAAAVSKKRSRKQNKLM